MDQTSVAVITGAASGIGRSLAIRFAKEQIAGIAISDWNETGLLETAAEVQKLGVPVSTHVIDVSEPFDIDNTQPTVSVSGQPQVTGDSARVVFLASDRGSYITRAEYSVNGGDWHSVFADDGISDGPDERYTVNVPLRAAGEYSITLRVFDATGNMGNSRAIVKK
jgi:NAD(P)-dependent dehydrogenase (short-subunit alcohol dehydrogenase family)